MAKLNLSQAAKVTGKNRTTIWRHINIGKLSSERDREGMPFVDTSELIRVYGELKQPATPEKENEQHKATPQYEELIKVINALRVEQIEMKEQITNLTNRLTHSLPSAADKPPTEQQRTSKPEDDPRWPVEIESITDITLRDEIRKEYDASNV